MTNKTGLMFVLVAWFAFFATLFATIQTEEPVSKVESSYEKALAEKFHAKRQVRLPDGARVDLVNDEYAIEIEFARKWAESVGQSLYYADVLGKKPGVILIVGSNDQRFEKRIDAVAGKHGIKVWKEPR